MRGWVAQWTLLVVQVKGPFMINGIVMGVGLIIFFVASWIGTGESHVVGNSCVFL